ncbi:HAMP domain-containing sensor histidine kinase [Paraburkholderia sp. SARCC-3016]|uniref:sensor histidine kinase n=1 Tax=Paraburkholderia sp. SARCC-3016 TaxID=3058611 RepID=UPI0028072B0E|nr:HAMP domain-containing sensor histidine kinase [Paraburkholderia sp. SARCC-3016]MDQ7981331.1 HAMP domain-containing sensor histidine kinase [Paraburkholderia sp. SARCC-3016]
MDLCEFINENLEALVDDRLSAARTLRAIGGIARTELQQTARRTLLDIVDRMRRPQAGHDAAGPPGAMSSERLPGGESGFDVQPVSLPASGYSLNDLTEDYRLLRASVVKRWLPADAQMDPAALHELVRFNNAVDEALTEAVARYWSGMVRTRDQFIGILAHDLRTPLGAISMSVEYLMRLEEQPASALRSIAVVQRSCARIQRMLDDLLDFTRTRIGGALPVNPEPVNLGNICQQALAELSALHMDEEIRWNSGGDLAGEWDAARLAQVITNLLENAIEHGRRGAVVRLSTRGEADSVYIVVSNEGEPIPDSELDRLFDPLIRRSTQTEPRRAGAGLGLGLFIARQIVVSHGGNISAASDANATSFTVRLPRTCASGGKGSRE